MTEGAKGEVEARPEGVCEMEKIIITHSTTQHRVVLQSSKARVASFRKITADPHGGYGESLRDQSMAAY